MEQSAHQGRQTRYFSFLKVNGIQEWLNDTLDRIPPFPFVCLNDGFAAMHQDVFNTLLCAVNS